jgi:putative ABC transport system permease protein
LDQPLQAFRTLARHKRFAATAIVCLGLAISLNTTMYSVMDAIVMPRIDIPDHERLYTVRFFGDRNNLIPGHEEQAALLNASFHAGVVSRFNSPDDALVERGAILRESNVVTVSPNFFAVMGVRAAAGRLIDERDVADVRRPVVVSERLWRQLFPEKKKFEPSNILAGGNGRHIVGLLPYSADFPGSYTDVWQLPLPSELPSLIYYIARLKPDVPHQQMEAEMAVHSLRLREMAGEDIQTGWRIRAATSLPFRRFQFHYAMIGAVVAVLLIACANLANLQLARGVSRTRELATRAAIGATRRDIVRQLMLESSWLALGGLVLGGVLTAWGIALIDHFVPPGIQEYVTYPQVSWRVLVFAVLSMLVCLVLVGLLPALKLSRVDVNTLLKSGAGTGKTVSARRQYGLLVVTEVALALSLLSAAGMLVKAALQVRAFTSDDSNRNLVRGAMLVARAHPNDLRTRRDWSETLINRAMLVDSMTRVATATMGCATKRMYSTYDAAGQPRALPTFQCYRVVSPEYFRVEGYPIVEGRDFAPGEFAEPQVIVDQYAARSLWPGRSAVGQQIKLDSIGVRGPWYRVVGVVGQAQREWFSPNLDEMLLRKQTRAPQTDRVAGQVYVLNAGDTAHISPASAGRRGGDVFQMIARSRGDPRRVPLQLSKRLEELGPNVRSAWFQTWDDFTGVSRYKTRQDFMGSLFATFAFFALALAALGVYAIIAHMVAQRTREFGVRIAVGAGDRDIRHMVMREGNILTLAGIAVGLVITWKYAAYVRAFVFSDWDRYDSRVFAIVALVLFTVAWVASYLPARRAMRINPVEALRND